VSDFKNFSHVMVGDHKIICGDVSDSLKAYEGLGRVDIVDVMAQQWLEYLK
jgi:hypothetical protein